MISSPKISICIPTFNRSSCLDQLLTSIVGQVPANNYNDLEICISDNNSNDDTYKTVGKHQEKFKNIFYTRQSHTINAPLNLEAVMAMGKGEYLWIIGDDDIVFPGIILYLIERLSEPKYAAILLNFSQGENQNPKIIMMDNCLGVNRDEIYPDPRKMFAGGNSINLFGINFMSALIFRRRNYLEALNLSKKFLSTCYFQTYTFLHIALSGSVLRIAKPCVIWRSWSDKRRYDQDQESEEHIMSQQMDYVKYARILGYDISNADEKSLERRWVSAEQKYKIASILDKIGLLSFVKAVKRIPRLMRYFINLKND